MESGMLRIDLKKRQEWQERITAWKQSGLSAARWCRENGASNCQFDYWKKLLYRAPEQQTAAGFSELITAMNEPVETGVEICFRGMIIRVQPRFDEDTLTRVVHLLGRES